MIRTITITVSRNIFERLALAPYITYVLPHCSLSSRAMPNNHCVLITVKLFFHEWNPYFFTCQHCFQIMVLSILSMQNPQPGRGGGGRWGWIRYSRFQVTEMIKRSFGVWNFSIPGILLGKKIWQVFFGVAWFKLGFFRYLKQYKETLDFYCFHFHVISLIIKD